MCAVSNVCNFHVHLDTYVCICHRCLLQLVYFTCSAVSFFFYRRLCAFTIIIVHIIVSTPLVFVYWTATAIQQKHKQLQVFAKRRRSNCNLHDLCKSWFFTAIHGDITLFCVCLRDAFVCVCVCFISDVPWHVVEAWVRPEFSAANQV